MTAAVARIVVHLKIWIAVLAEPPRVDPRWPSATRIAVAAAVAVTTIAAAMWLFDSWPIRHHGDIPRRVVILFGAITDFGKSDWFLLPAGFLLLAIAAVASPALGRMSYLVLMSLAARLGFIFLGIALPSLFTTIVKRMIGRARPLRIEGTDLYFSPFAWRVDFASLPSGHSTTAFAAAAALGALFPGARVALWTYAVAIALSRVVLRNHYPSDVIAGAIVGVCGALLVRRWFAARRLAFTVRPDASVRALPGPSLQRIKEVAGRLAGQ